MSRDVPSAKDVELAVQDVVALQDELAHHDFASVPSGKETCDVA
jgi:hypothetical protein